MKQNNHKSLLLVIAMISLLVGQLLFLVGCATPKKDWEKAQRLNTIEAYEEFLQKHPDSEFAYEAKHKIEELAWEKVRQKDSINAYENFLQKYPKSKFVTEARHRIERKIKFLKSLPMPKTIGIEISKQNPFWFRELVKRDLTQALEEKGFKVTPFSSADIKVMIGEMKSFVPAGGILTFYIMAREPTAGSLCMSVSVSLFHRQAGSIFTDKEIKGEAIYGSFRDANINAKRVKSLEKNIVKFIVETCEKYFSSGRR